MIRAFQWDLARQIERHEFLLGLLPRYAEWGYQELYLHLEDALDYPSLPGVARADAWTYAQLEQLVETATRVGIKVVPIVNLLGHTQYLIKTRELRDMNELRDASGAPLERGQICPLHPRTTEIAEALLRDMSPFCTAGKVHVGLDESFHLGKCPRCREEVARIGLGRHFSSHVNRLHAITQQLGLRMGIWADMLAFVPEAISELPAGIIAYDWYYYPFRKLPRVELHNFAEIDLATPLRKQGVAYYGCPMNGAFRWEPLPSFSDRFANILSWWAHCKRTKAEGFLMTSWEPNRLALELTTVVDAATACLWLEPGVTEPADMLERGFARLFGKAHAKRSARLALAADEFPFSGYHTWQINDRWDVHLTGESLAPLRGQAATLRRLARNSADTPPALAASLRYRDYLAERDLFVRSNAMKLFSLRDKSESRQIAGLRFALAAAAGFTKQIKAARRDVRTMWRRSRDPKATSPNELLLNLDTKRLAELRQWLRRAIKKPVLLEGATPLFGHWQLQFTVINHAPALQKIIVEQKQPDGSWKVLHGLHTIEFKASAAKPRADIRRAWSVPIIPADNSANPPRLRIALRGVGEVRIADIRLAESVSKSLPLKAPRPLRLGTPAQKKGFPVIDWESNGDESEISYGEADYSLTGI